MFLLVFLKARNNSRNYGRRIMKGTMFVMTSVRPEADRVRFCPNWPPI
jgi:hypothetical protein